MTSQGLVGSVAVLLSFLLQVEACSDANMQGSNSQSPQNPSAAAPADPSPAPVAVADAAANGGNHTDATSNGVLSVTKTMPPLTIVDATITFTISNAADAGASGQPLTFTAGSSGTGQLANLCNDGTPTHLIIGSAITNTSLANSLKDSSSTPTLSGSSFSFEPSTCKISQFLDQGQGDTFNFTCPNSVVTISAAPAAGT